MAKKDFKDYICRPYCIFFREGQKEDMACQGAVVTERLVERGILNPGGLGGRPKSREVFANREESLNLYVCGRCPFRKEDCDFQSQDPPADAEPCGGYILLALLKEEGVLTEADLAEAADE